MLTILNSLVLLTVKIIVRGWVVYFFATQCIISNITAICASQHRVLLACQNVYILYGAKYTRIWQASVLLQVHDV